MAKIIIPKQSITKPNERQSKVFLHIGAKNTGKTQATLNMMSDMFRSQRKPILVLDKGRQDEYDNFISIELNNIPDFNRLASLAEYPFFKCRISQSAQIISFFELVDEFIRNSFVVFEDSTTYMRGNLKAAQENLIVNSRNVCNDYLFNLHALSSAAPFLLQHSEFMVLRATGDNIKNLPKKIPAINKIIQAMLEIKAENLRKYPRSDQRKIAFRLVDLETID